MTDWPSIGVTAALGVAGLYVGDSVRRKTRAEIEAKVVERRLKAYEALWETMREAAPMDRLKGKAALSEEQRQTLYDALTKWYFEGGNGMVLSEGTRNIYLTGKQNLICKVKDLQPASLRKAVQATPEDEVTIRGKASTRQLSLLRTSMRADLLVYTGPWGQRLTREDRRFLAACGVPQWRRPWRPSLRRGPLAEEEQPNGISKHSGPR